MFFTSRIFCHNIFTFILVVLYIFLFRRNWTPSEIRVPTVFLGRRRHGVPLLAAAAGLDGLDLPAVGLDGAGGDDVAGGHLVLALAFLLLAASLLRFLLLLLPLFLLPGPLPEVRRNHVPKFVQLN